MRQRFREKYYIMTLHGEEEMDADNLTIYDVENCILAGRIIERQQDAITAEWKYRIEGKALDDGKMETIAKLSPTGKLVIITTYRI